MIKIVALVLFPLVLFSQQPEKMKVNDFNTPLHLATPDYPVQYGIPDPEAVEAVLLRVYNLLEKETPCYLIESPAQEKISDISKIDKNTQLAKGSFRLASYEWGVTYSGMLRAGKCSGNEVFSNYTRTRLAFLADVAPYFEKVARSGNLPDAQIRQLISPHALDDAGSMCVAFIKNALENQNSGSDKVIRNYIDYIENKQFRLSDGTLARNRPQQNTLWLDDMFMGIPSLAWMGKYSGETKYFDEAARQVRLFAKRMFVPEKGLFMHGWVQEMDPHPAFFWGRANGWAILTLVEVLDALPSDHPAYPEIMSLMKAHLKGLAGLQSSSGFWHQLLDRNDTYLETSATAIYTYCFAHAVNNGWVDPLAYGPVALLGWNAVATKITDEGFVQGTCVGTGMGFDPAYYSYRPVNVYAAHGYGPALLAGAEIIELIKKHYPKMNDSAVQFYDKAIETEAPIFEVK